MEDAAEAMQRTMDRLMEHEQRLLRQGTANTAVQSQLKPFARGRGLRGSKDRKWTREDWESPAGATERRQSGETGKSSRARTLERVTTDLQG